MKYYKRCPLMATTADYCSEECCAWWDVLNSRCLIATYVINSGDK